MTDATTMILTGAGGTIGRAIALRLAARGIPLMLTDADPAALEGCLSDVRQVATGRGTQCLEIVADLTVTGASAEIVARAGDALGDIGGCINAAAVADPVIDSRQLTTELMEPAYRVNVHALVEMCGAAIAALVRRGTPGRIVNLASGAAISGAAYMVTYNSSKHAVLGATRSLAREYAAREISVNAVCPGFVASPMVDRILASTATITGQRDDPVARIPAGRFADPDEVASVVEYVALDSPTYLTGAAIIVDGGLYA